MIVKNMGMLKRCIIGHNNFRAVCIIFLMSFVLSIDGKTTTDYLSKSVNGSTGLLFWDCPTDHSRIQIWKDKTKILDEDNLAGMKNTKYIFTKKSDQIEFKILNLKPEDIGVYSCLMIKGNGTSNCSERGGIKLDVNGDRFLKAPNKTVCAVNGTLYMEWRVEIPLALNLSAISVYAPEPNGQRSGLYSYDWKNNKTISRSDCEKKEHFSKNNRIITLSCSLIREELRRYTFINLEIEFPNYFLQTPRIQITGECLEDNVNRTVDNGNITMATDYNNTTVSTTAKNESKVGVIVGTIGSVVGVLAIACFIYRYRYLKKKKLSMQNDNNNEEFETKQGMLESNV